MIETSIDGLNKSKDIKADIVITTWQSLENGKTKIPKAWYQQFGVVFGDEAHGCKAATLKSILGDMVNCRYRFGLTGTLDNLTLNTVTIDGLFGTQYKSISTKDLIDRGFASKLKIKCIILKYPKEVSKVVSGYNYNDEVDFLIAHKGRTKFIRNLALSLKGNKLIFFRKIEHGNLIKAAFDDVENVYHIDGAVSAADREAIRHAMEKEEDAILLGSLGTTSTGINIKRLLHMIAASPSKSKIKVLQSIGRILRLHVDKEEKGATLYDIVDDFSYKSKKNFTLQHFEERVKIYDAEEFDYKIYTVSMK